MNFGYVMCTIIFFIVTLMMVIKKFAVELNDIDKYFWITINMLFFISMQIRGER